MIIDNTGKTNMALTVGTAASADCLQRVVRRVREYEKDHAPSGWPAVQMNFLTEMANAIEAMLPKPRKYPRAKCPDCGQEFALHDGKIWNHIIGQKQCPGAGKRVTPNILAEPSAPGRDSAMQP